MDDDAFRNILGKLDRPDVTPAQANDAAKTIGELRGKAKPCENQICFEMI